MASEGHRNIGRTAERRAVVGVREASGTSLHGCHRDFRLPSRAVDTSDADSNSVRIRPTDPAYASSEATCDIRAGIYARPTEADGVGISVTVKPQVAPVSAHEAVRASIVYDQVRSAAGAVHWLESRPGAAGAALMRWEAGTGTVDISPPDGIRSSGAHAYGGGDYAVDGDQVAFLPPTDGPYAFGDLVVGNGEALAVRESVDGDVLVAWSPPRTSRLRVLVDTTGFLGSPRLGPGRLAWSRWSRDDMPWDACELWTAPYRPGGDVSGAVRVAGGAGESVIEPRWGPDRLLYFMSDRTGWWNLYRWDGVAVRAVAPIDAECAAEPWELGYASYAFLDGGRVAMTVQRGPRHALAVVEADGAVWEPGLPYTSIKPYLAASGSSVALVGSSPTAAPQVALVDLGSRSPQVQVLARPEPAAPDRAPVSVPVEVRVTVAAARDVVALVYPPTGARADWRAPVIVRAHPGPTASSDLRLDWQAQFFTSRGFAVVDVDYIGSTGYGRGFRQALYGRWGLDEVADCRALADHLIANGRAVADQVFIRGASAGGWTALHAISQDGPFAAATAISAIVDADRWAASVPRFQRAHALRLRGGAGPVRADRIRRPVLLVHGADDDVAAADDVRRLAADLERLGHPGKLLLLDGAGHSVATSAAAADVLEAELAHYRSVMNLSR